MGYKPCAMTSCEKFGSYIGRHATKASAYLSRMFYTD